MYSLIRYIEHFTFIIFSIFDYYIIRIIAGKLNLLYIPPYFKIPYSSLHYLDKDITHKTKPIIPKNIFLCYKDKNIPQSIIDNIHDMNPTWKIELYGNNECAKFILKYYGKILYDLFENIKDGPIKSDLFRICILYHYGGVYTDIDNIIMKPLDEIIIPGTTFGVGLSYNQNNVNPAFLFSTKNNKILSQCIELYKNIIINYPYSYWGYSIVYNMTFILKNYIDLENKSRVIDLYKYNQKIQFYKEEYDYNIYQLFKCALNPQHNLLKYVYLFDNNNNKIIALHNEIYNSSTHSF